MEKVSTLLIHLQIFMNLLQRNIFLLLLGVKVYEITAV